MGVPSLIEDESACRSMHPQRSIKPFQSVGSIRPIFQPVQLAIGYLGFASKNTTLSKILTRKAGKSQSFCELEGVGFGGGYF